MSGEQTTTGGRSIVSRGSTASAYCPLCEFVSKVSSPVGGSEHAVAWAGSRIRAHLVTFHDRPDIAALWKCSNDIADAQAIFDRLNRLTKEHATVMAEAQRIWSSSREIQQQLSVIVERWKRLSAVFQGKANAEGMSDNPEAKGPADRKRVNVHEDYEVRYWTEKFKITPEHLKKVVEKVGPMAADVEMELRKT